MKPITEGNMNWMDEARQIAAQCWCDDETKDRVMDPTLAEAVAKRIAAWMDTAAQAQRNADYYRGLLERCGNAIGEAAHICDDGSRSEDVLNAKVPELVEALVAGKVFPQGKTEPSDPNLKRPRLFYYEDPANCWAPVPFTADEIPGVLSIEQFVDDGEVIELEFRRFDMTDAEFAAIPEV